MAISLVKGQRADLTKDTGLSKILVGLGWDTNCYGDEDFDLDASAVLTTATGRVSVDEDIVFYNNLKHYSKSVEHTGDNLTGEGDGDDEVIKVNLNSVPEQYQRIT